MLSTAFTVFCIASQFCGCIPRSIIRVPLVNKKVITHVGRTSLEIKLSPLDQNVFHSSQVRNCFGSSFQVGAFRIPDRHARVVTQESSSRLAIGPRSQLVSRSGSAAVVGDELVVGDRDGSIFRSSCIPGTIVSIPIRPTGPSFFSGSIRVGSAEETSDSSLRVNIGETEGTSVEVPYSLWSELNYGLRPKLLGAFFNIPCTSDDLARYPVLDLIVESDGSVLRLYPQDYLAKRDDNICMLKLRPGTQRRIVFNPLTVPNTNVRITKNGFEICDRIL